MSITLSLCAWVLQRTEGLKGKEPVGVVQGPKGREELGN